MKREKCGNDKSRLLRYNKKTADKHERNEKPEDRETEMRRIMKKAIVFDLDGTLWDSREEVSVIWNQVFAKHPEISLRLTGKDIGNLMGKTVYEIGRILFPEWTEDKSDAMMEECAGAENGVLIESGAILFDGVEEMLHKLKEEYSLYIVSNCQQGYEEAFMVAHGVKDCFEDVETSGRTGMGKGHNIRLILERNGVEKAVYIGDTAGDERASREAGIPFLYAAYGFGKAEAPDGVVYSPKEIPDAVRTFLE